MAYYDANGKITIDEVAAARDIRKLTDAVEILNNMKAEVNAAAQLTASFSGQFAEAQLEKANQLSKMISTNIDNINESISAIRFTVKKYKTIDAKLKQQIISSGGGIPGGAKWHK